MPREVSSSLTRPTWNHGAHSSEGARVTFAGSRGRAPSVLGGRGFESRSLHLILGKVAQCRVLASTGEYSR
jgi:hypothetical protein